MEYTKQERQQHRNDWVKALRSGEYNQIQGRLKRNDEGFCCLGVACEISGVGQWLGAGYDTQNDFRSNVLPGIVVDFYGLRENGGKYNDESVEGGINSLYALNDGGKNFEEIATVIEEEPEGLLRKN